MDISKDTPLILGRPFLSTAEAQINVGAGEIRFNINDKEERFPFQPKVEQCSMIKIKFGPNSRGIQEVVVTPRKKDNMVSLVKEVIKEGKHEEVVIPVQTTPQDQPSSSRVKKSGESTAIRHCSSQDGCSIIIKEESCTLDFKRRAHAKGKLVFISYLFSTFQHFLCTLFVFIHCMFENFKIVFCMLEFFLALFHFYKKKYTKNIF